MIGIEVIGADLVAKTFKAAATSIGPRTQRRLRYWAARTETGIKGRASGRPGPRTITGDYRRSWTTEAVSRGPASGFAIFTDKKQGRRLEEGFVGTDSLGRHYNQPPYRHVLPVRQEIEPQFLADMAKTAKEGL